MSSVPSWPAADSEQQAITFRFFHFYIKKEKKVKMKTFRSITTGILASHLDLDVVFQCAHHMWSSTSQKWSVCCFVRVQSARSHLCSLEPRANFRLLLLLLLINGARRWKQSRPEEYSLYFQWATSNTTEVAPTSLFPEKLLEFWCVNEIGSFAFGIDSFSNPFYSNSNPLSSFEWLKCSA